MTEVFISHPTPCNKQQASLLKLIDEKLEKHGLVPVNLGKKNWNYKKPLEPIKKIMSTCKGAIIVGLERHHSFIGYEKEAATKKSDKKELVHKYSTTPWVQIEGGMAYQAGLPLLILKEKKIHPEGILDPNNSDSYIFEFEIEKNYKKLSAEMERIIESWAEEIGNKK
jgi:hypothetical protein